MSSFEEFSKPASGKVQMRPNRSRWHSKSLTDFAVLPPLQIVEEDNLTLQGRKLHKRCGESIPQLRSHRISEGVVMRCRNGPFQRLCLSKRLSTDQIARPVLDDGRKPACKPFRISTLLQTIQCDQKGFLCHILRILSVARNSKRHEIGCPLVSTDKHSKGFRISALGGMHQ
jgi:hypothetical protein